MHSVVFELQAELSRSGRHDGRTRYLFGTYDHFAVGSALQPGVRQAVEALCPVGGGSWRCDETYIKVKGTWMYLYRAVDKAGQTVDFYLSRRRDVAAAKAFLRKAMREQRTPTKITLDAYRASHRAVADLKTGELPKRVQVRSSKYLNNTIEQDHRRVKHRLGPMLGLKSFQTAAVVIGGIELAEKIKKGQFKIGKLGGTRANMTEIWRAALAA